MHVKREHNKAADYLANQAMDTKSVHERWFWDNINDFIDQMVEGTRALLHCRFDGGFRAATGIAAAGVRVQFVTFHGQTR